MSSALAICLQTLFIFVMTVCGDHGSDTEKCKKGMKRDQDRTQASKIVVQWVYLLNRTRGCLQKTLERLEDVDTNIAVTFGRLEGQMRQLLQTSVGSGRSSAYVKTAREAVLSVLAELQREGGSRAANVRDQLRSASKWTVEHQAALDAIEPISNCLWDAKTNGMVAERQEALNELFKFVPGVNESGFCKNARSVLISKKDWLEDYIKRVKGVVAAFLPIWRFNTVWRAIENNVQRNEHNCKLLDASLLLVSEHHASQNRNVDDGTSGASLLSKMRATEGVLVEKVTAMSRRRLHKQRHLVMLAEDVREVMRAYEKLCAQFKPRQAETEVEKVLNFGAASNECSGYLSISAGTAARHGSGSDCLAPVIELSFNMTGVSSASASADVARSNASSGPAIERLAEKVVTYATQLGQDIEEVDKLERCLSTLNKMKFDLQSEVVRQRDVAEQRSTKHTCKDIWQQLLELIPR
ncbi:hypothetical protein ERJ75_000081700 [Trypanosoma vivax]|nr:hypothetical protein ERJ75_000081700 [Trypanosoma vivax]